MSRWKSTSRKCNDPSTELPSVEVKSEEKETVILPVSGNRIYFYSDVTRESIYVLNRQIDEMTRHLKSVQFNYGLDQPPVIDVYISSEGGDVFPAMSTVDKIVSNPIPIHTHCEGIVASAATLISVAGKKRTISPNSSMLVHSVTSGFWGNFQEFKDEIRNLELIMKLIKKIYLKYTKFKECELDELLKHDLVLDADECKRVGLVDKVL
jgi:ATP-dependent protease ClpP protease subunit